MVSIGDVCNHVANELWCLLTVVKSPFTLVQWCIPPIMHLIGLFLQNVQLHIGTVRYVEMMRVAPNTCPDTLYDTFHEMLGYAKIDMNALDKITLIPVAVWGIGTLYLRDLRLWTKIFCCAAILHVWKGVFTWITVLKDSSGWDNCKERLGDTIKWHESMVGKSWLEVAGNAVGIVFAGYEGVNPVRFCADMVPSGHTFTAFLFSLGMIDMARRLHVILPRVPGIAVLAIAYPLAATLFFLEFYFVLLNHFHYALDMFMAVLLVLLFYTNAGVALFVDWYVERFKREEDRTGAAGMIWIPTFFLPFCFFGGHYMLQQTKVEDVKEVILAGNTRLQDIYEAGKGGQRGKSSDEGSSPVGELAA